MVCKYYSISTVGVKLKAPVYRPKSVEVCHHLCSDPVYWYTVRPPIKDTPKEDKPPNKRQAKSTLLYTL